MATNTNNSSETAVIERRIYDAIPTIIRDPRVVQRLIVNTVESVSGGEFRIIDPTNPFVLMMEMTAQLASAAVGESDALNRRQYASAATDIDDIFFHLSDYDMFGAYATPSTGTMIVIMNVDTIRARAVATDNVDVRKIVIPKHAAFTVANYTFTMQYPVDIVVMEHGGVTVRYDRTQTSPIYPAETMPLKTSSMRVGDTEWIGIHIPVKQMILTSRVMQVNSATGAVKQFQFPDNFCYLRAYQKSTDDATWTEIGVVMNKEIYDPTIPSVAIRVLRQNVEVFIPQIYFSNGLIKDAVRLDIYSTKGRLELDLSTYATEAFAADWLDYDSTETSKYSKVLLQFDGLTMSAEKTVSGGSAAMTFDQLRKRTISMSAADYGYAITPDQVENLLNTNGYDLVSNIDDITDRQFLATRLLPAPISNTLDETIGGTNQQQQAQAAQLTVTGIGVDVRLLQTSLAALELNRHVFFNNRRTTITPRVLYRLNQDMLEIVPHETVDEILQIGQTQPESVANLVNSGDYLYTPFYTVMDVQTDDFTTRFYNLDTPRIVSNFTSHFNTSAQVSVSCSGYQIEPNVGSGYTVRLRFTGDNVWKKFTSDRIGVQITVADGSNRTWWTGTLVNPVDENGLIIGDPIFIFYIDTDYDVDTFNRLIVSEQRVPVPMEANFQALVIVKDHMPENAAPSDIDLIAAPDKLTGYDRNSTYLGVLNETIRIELGNALDHLWSSNRSIVDPSTYKTYDSDVYAYYSEDIYKRDADGAIELVKDPVTNKWEPVILHKAGDIMNDEFGQPIVRFPKGSVIIDAEGNPEIIGGERAILRHFDMTLFDGRYYFATDSLTQAYITSIISKIVAWVTVDMPNIKNQLIDRSTLYFHPKTTTGYMTVITGDTDTAVVRADQELHVTYYVTKANYDNAELRKYITDYTPRILKMALENRTVSTDSIVTALRTAMGDDILSVSISGFVDNRYQIITLTDDSMLPSVGKRLIALASKELRVEDAVTVEILKHVETLSN